MSYKELLGKANHKLNKGASEKALKACEAKLGKPLPKQLREFLAFSNGALLFAGAVEIWSTTKLPEKDKGMKGGWFNEQHLFFAESNPDDDLWYFMGPYEGHECIELATMKVTKDKDLLGFAAVRYFSSYYYEHGLPKIVEDCAASFNDWLKLLVKQNGYGVPKEILKF